MFAKLRFCNSALWIMCLQSSASATPLKGKYVCEVSIPQFRSRGNDFAKFHTIPHKGNVFSKFCNSALRVYLPEVPLLQLRSRGNVFAKFHSRGIHLHFRFRNSSVGKMSSQSSASAILL